MNQTTELKKYLWTPKTKNDGVSNHKRLWVPMVVGSFNTFEEHTYPKRPKHSCAKQKTKIWVQPTSMGTRNRHVRSAFWSKRHLVIRPSEGFCCFSRSTLLPTFFFNAALTCWSSVKWKSPNSAFAKRGSQ